MQPKELGAIQVRDELETLIEKYPNRKGSITIPSPDHFENDEPGDYDFQCIYYLDENDAPINLSNYGASDQPVFKTPVCIVGQWIEDFHPEFKNNELIQSILVRNSTISSLFEDENPFTKEVKEVLTTAQNAQDATNAEWRDIVLN